MLDAWLAHLEVCKGICLDCSHRSLISAGSIPGVTFDEEMKLQMKLGVTR